MPDTFLSYSACRQIGYSEEEPPSNINLIKAEEKLAVRACRLGFGCFAKTVIFKGEIITPLFGSIFKEKDYKNQPHFWGDSFYDNLIQIGDCTYLIVPRPLLLLNHSCNPNVGIIGKNLIAISNITVGEEVCFDYSTSVDEDGYWQMPCECQQKNCRGLIGDFISLPYRLQRKYLRYNIVMPFIVKKYFYSFKCKSLNKPVLFYQTPKPIAVGVNL